MAHNTITFYKKEEEEFQAMEDQPKTSSPWTTNVNFAPESDLLGLMRLFLEAQHQRDDFLQELRAPNSKLQG